MSQFGIYNQEYPKQDYNQDSPKQIQCSVNTRPDYGGMRTKLKGGILLSHSYHHCLGSDSVREKNKRAVAGEVYEKVKTLTYPGTIFSPDGQFCLMSDHPALKDTNLQLHIKGYE